MLVYLRVDEILDSSRLLWTLVAPSAQRSRGGIWQQLSFSGPLFVSAQRVLLVSNAQAVLRPMAPTRGAPESPELLAWPRSRIKPGAGLTLAGSGHASGSAGVPRRPPGRQRAGTGWTWCPRYPSTFGSAGAQLAAAIAATAAWLRSQIKA